MDAIQFAQKTGRAPEQDDLERVNCSNVGEPGHAACGWCNLHDGPRFQCGCLYRPGAFLPPLNQRAIRRPTPVSSGHAPTALR